MTTTVPAPCRHRASKLEREMLYKPLVDAWMLYDNAGEAPVLVASGSKP